MLSMQSPQQLASRRSAMVAGNSLAALVYSVVTVLNYGTQSRFATFAWLVWLACSMLWVFGTPGRFRFTRDQRALVNDEYVRHHQCQAAKFCMTLAVLSLAIASVASLGFISLAPWSTPAALSGSIVATGFYFAWLERTDG
ncbi:hypothetical protein HMF7854_11145 [Sphingomonas ginkgonis]|uniref:Uncharacterized protein n=1 Tax=Sphingomonas ginkgonis TaxID=2315330 RepID=A0A429VBY2_9SPHN|nr:hypothetical protein [Sphingomonas ginkgonis]RST31332.1 hypothetical protein HMF7854_11145 [Sphingomonas ginkgonis]